MEFILECKDCLIDTKVKRKTHKIISTDAGEALDETPKSFLIKIRYRRKASQHKKDATLTGEEPKLSPIRSGTGKGAHSCQQST